MKIDVYDFDGTLYRGDSTFDYIVFIVKRHIYLIFLFPIILIYTVLLLFNGSLTVFKGRLFHLFSKFIDLKEEGKKFWSDEKINNKINKWFYECQKDIPVVIASASVDVELMYAPPVKQCDVLICTQLDDNGYLRGKNCKSTVKIERIKQIYGNVCIRSMYTDNIKADGPLLDIAEEKYIVDKKGNVNRIK